MARDAADAWVECTCGSRHWGLAGAAGLALVADGLIALQLRAAWSHQGGTWALPGGAIGTGETPLEGALREAAEEAAVPAARVRPLASRVLDHGVWSYTTIVAAVDGERPELQPLDGESADLRWVPLAEVAGLDLHPAFAAAWPLLRALVDLEPELLVDAANVVGSRPDGWWRDRAGATTRLLASLEAALVRGVPAAWFGLDADRVWPDVTVVLEGAARPATAPARTPVAFSLPQLRTVAASGPGDDAVTDYARASRAAPLVVVTADRGLRGRLPAGTLVLGPGTLRDALD